MTVTMPIISKVLVSQFRCICQMLYIGRIKRVNSIKTNLNMPERNLAMQSRLFVKTKCFAKLCSSYWHENLFLFSFSFLAFQLCNDKPDSAHKINFLFEFGCWKRKKKNIVKQILQGTVPLLPYLRLQASLLKERRNKSCEFSDPPGPMQRYRVFFILFLDLPQRYCTFLRTCERTDGRTPCVKLMTTYWPGPGGSKVQNWFLLLHLMYDFAATILNICVYVLKGSVLKKSSNEYLANKHNLCLLRQETFALCRNICT